MLRDFLFDYYDFVYDNCLLRNQFLYRSKQFLYPSRYCFPQNFKDKQNSLPIDNFFYRERILFVSMRALMAVRKTFNAILMRGYFSTNFLLLYIMCKLLEPPHTLFFLLSMHNNVSFNIFAQNKQVIRRRSDNPYDVRIFNGNNIFRYMESMEMSLHFLFCGSLNLR